MVAGLGTGAAGTGGGRQMCARLGRGRGLDLSGGASAGDADRHEQHTRSKS